MNGLTEGSGATETIYEQLTPGTVVMTNTEIKSPLSQPIRP